MTKRIIVDERIINNILEKIKESLIQIPNYYDSDDQQLQVNDKVKLKYNLLEKNYSVTGIIQVDDTGKVYIELDKPIYIGVFKSEECNKLYLLDDNMEQENKLYLFPYVSSKNLCKISETTNAYFKCYKALIQKNYKELFEDLKNWTTSENESNYVNKQLQLLNEKTEKYKEILNIRILADNKNEKVEDEIINNILNKIEGEIKYNEILINMINYHVSTFKYGHINVSWDYRINNKKQMNILRLTLYIN